MFVRNVESRPEMRGRVLRRIVWGVCATNSLLLLLDYFTSEFYRLTDSLHLAPVVVIWIVSAPLIGLLIAVIESIGRRRLGLQRGEVWVDAAVALCTAAGTYGTLFVQFLNHLTL